MVVPAVAQEDADGVVARLQLGGDVVGDVEVAEVFALQGDGGAGGGGVCGGAEGGAQGGADG